MYFYDTCSLLRLQEQAFSEPLWICETTVKELEDIKTSGKKTEEIRAQARNVVRLIEQNIDNIQFAAADESDTGDLSIINACLRVQHTDESVLFVTDDILCRLVARIKGVKVAIVETDDKAWTYKGYMTVQLCDEAMAEFYSNLQKNSFNCLCNQYIRILNQDGDLVDLRKWNGTEYVGCYNKGLKSLAFGDKLKPRDEFQRMAVDSIMSNTLTLLSGKAGSGKSLISLAAIFHLIEKGSNYDRVVVLTNPCKVRGVADMGYYTGDAQKKMMQNSIGNILITKFGDRYIVDQLINQEKLKLVSMADCRGMEIRDNEILYVSECQNASVDTIKLILSRASQGCKVILEGDFDAQVDSWMYEGRNNGMKRIVEKLQGEDLFGYVELPNVWRSKLAELAQKL